jgi:hypothetical protein
MASLLTGFADAPAVHADDQAVVSSQAGGDSDGAMNAMDCSACAAMGACIASRPALPASLCTSRLPPAQPSSHPFGQVRAPETAPPKPSSI